jgi:hypothetical protein
MEMLSNARRELESHGSRSQEFENQRIGVVGRYVFISACVTA